MARRSSARVHTDRPARYGKQLASHLGRRNHSEWSEPDRTGFIQFSDARAELSCAPDGLQITVEGPAERLPALEDVVGRHLVRFGAKDELHVIWSRDDGRPGTEQHGTGD